MAPPDVRVLWSPPEVLSRYSCEFNVHHYFGFWRELLYGLLPFPHSTNESICVTADLRDNRTERRIGRYEECGFSRQFGILFLEWGDVPTIPRLRDVMVSRVLAEVVDGFRREAAQTAAPGGAKDDR